MPHLDAALFLMTVVARLICNVVGHLRVRHLTIGRLVKARDAFRALMS